jgi:hypothetical protein
MSDMSPEEIQAYEQQRAAKGATLGDKAGDPYAWADGILSTLGREFVGNGEALGFDKYTLQSVFDSYSASMLGYIEQEVIGGGLLDQITGTQWKDGDPVPVHAQDVLAKFGRNWLSGQDSSIKGIFAPNVFGDKLPKQPGRGGGGGARKLTAAEIRAQFDMDQLASSVTDLWRSNLLEEPRNARAIAKSYVDAVVATGGEQKIDFQTFVDKQMDTTPRSASLYRDKPPGMSKAQFMQPYVQAAAQHLRPTNVNETARAGAQLGASPGAFRDRLARSNEVRSSSPFITAMEGRMTELSKVFRG